MRLVRINVLFKIQVGHFVEILELAILFTFLLNSVVGEMNKFVIDVLEGVLLTGCPQVAVLVPVTLEIAVNAGEQDKHADVEFPLVVKIGVFHVFLDDHGSVARALGPQQVPDLFEAFDYRYSIASI